MELLLDLIIVLAVAMVVLFISTRLKLPSIIGLLIAGILVGPSGIELISDSQEVDALAEIGVLLLLFTIGIEFSLEKLIESRRFVLIGGTLQVFLTGLIVFLLLQFTDFGLQQTIFLSLLCTMSSTAIVLQLFQDKGWMNTLFGKNTVSVLIFQDIAIIPMMLLVPYLAVSDVGVSESPSILKLLTSILIVIVAVFAARKIIPFVLRQIIRSQNKDLFLIAILVICFSTSFITNMLGLKLALGAFLAGLVISESEYSHEVLKNILPFKKIFISLFFISIGMLLNLDQLYSSFHYVIPLVIGVLILKFLIVFFISYFLKIGIQNAIVSGIALSQVGEFAFILSKVGLDYQIINQDMYQLFLSVSILTMIISTFAVVQAPQLSMWIVKQSFLQPFLNRFDKQYCVPSEEAITNHSVILGFGLGGEYIAESLLKKGKTVLAVDLSERNFLSADKKIVRVIGDAKDTDVLKRAGIEQAELIVITVPHPSTSEYLTGQARKLNPHAKIIVRTKYRQEMEHLEQLGANHVFAEEVAVAEDIVRQLIPSL